MYGSTLHGNREAPRLSAEMRDADRVGRSRYSVGTSVGRIFSHVGIPIRVTSQGASACRLLMGIELFLKMHLSLSSDELTASWQH
jgi:hypothetical protein